MKCFNALSAEIKHLTQVNFVLGAESKCREGVMKMINAKEWNKGRLIVEQMSASKLRAEPLTWRNQPATNVIEGKYLSRMLDEINNMSKSVIDDRVVTYSGTIKYEPLICKCCGAPINRETMTCEYCGTQYGKG